MQITVELPEDVLELVKRYAAAHSLSIEKVISDRPVANADGQRAAGVRSADFPRVDSELMKRLADETD